MLSRSVLRGRSSAFASVRCAQRRGYAAAAGTANFETSEAAGIKLVSRNLPGPTASLALVAKAGTRYEWVPGLAEALEKFAFRNTWRRFAVRIVRETELLGSEIFSNRTREAVVFGAKFMKEDLPYFVELFSEVANETRYVQYMMDEVIDPNIAEAHEKYLSSSAEIALNAVHGVAFHRGLGNQLYPSSNVSAAHRVMAEEVNAYAGTAYTKPNIALVGSGVDKSELSTLTADFFKDTPQSSPAGLPGLAQAPSKYFGGEERIAFGKGNTMVIAFPGSSFGGASYKPEMDVLAALLGGHAAVKWSSGHSILAKAVSAHAGVSVKTETAKYSDTGLLYVTLSGPSKSLTGAAKDVVAAIKTVASGKVSKDDIKRATAYAKFKLYEATTLPSIETLGLSALNGKVQAAEDSVKGVVGVTESTLSQAGKKLFEGKASVASVGDLDSLPWAEELGLNV